jgi:hypothetical protein
MSKLSGITDNIETPNSWDDIFLEQFIELNTLKSENFTNTSSIHLEQLAILTDTSSDDEMWEDMDIRKLNKMIMECKFLKKVPTVPASSTILDGKYSRIDFNNLSNGEYIDLQYFSKDNSLENLHKVLSIIYRKEKVGEWGEKVLEPYDVIDIEERSEEILYNCMFHETYGIILEFNQWSNQFTESYKPLFEPEVEDDYDRDDLDEEELQELAEIEAQEATMNKWGWERLILSLADGDILKTEAALKMGLIHTFNLLSMKKELKIE